MCQQETSTLLKSNVTVILRTTAGVDQHKRVAKCRFAKRLRVRLMPAVSINVKFPYQIIWEHALETELKPISRKPILIWLIASQLLALVSLFFWLMVAGLSVMAFDSGESPEAWAFVITVWSYPTWPLVFSVSSWIAYARKKDKLAGILTTFTFLPVLLLILVIVFSNLAFTLGLMK
jgi:hypothetical protein